MRNEQIVAPLRAVILRPQDGELPDIVLFANKETMITPYFSSAKLSFETMRLIRQDMGLPELKNEADVQKELDRLMGNVQ